MNQLYWNVCYYKWQIAKNNIQNKANENAKALCIIAQCQYGAVWTLDKFKHIDTFQCYTNKLKTSIHQHLSIYIHTCTHTPSVPNYILLKRMFQFSAMHFYMHISPLWNFNINNAYIIIYWMVTYLNCCMSHNDFRVVFNRNVAILKSWVIFDMKIVCSEPSAQIRIQSFKIDAI